jgi:hypothetical protein
MNITFAGILAIDGEQSSEQCQFVYAPHPPRLVGS